MAYLWGQLIPMDGNTVECCENSRVKDQSGNELRLCSAIDEERIRAEEEEKKNNQVIAYICEITSQSETSKGYRFRTGEQWACFKGNEILSIYARNYPALGEQQDILIGCPNFSWLYKGHKKIYLRGEVDYYTDGGLSGKEICDKVDEGIKKMKKKRNPNFVY